jgi:hypothetical protein
MQEYRSLYPNHAHQLAVSVSKHLFVTKSGKLKFQIKPFEVSLTDLPGEKEHIVIFALRDHCSGVSYAEIRLGSQIGQLTSFLAKAWMQKVGHPFCGAPEIILISKTAESAFPGTAEAIEGLGVQVLPVASGFQTNIGDVKVIESRFKLMDGESAEVLTKFGPDWSADFSNQPSRVRGKTKLDLWTAHVKEVLVPPDGWGVA